MHQLVLIRHGESTWNRENRFTGWCDVPLTETGIQQARRAGQQLAQAGCDFDVAWTSVLQRATHTLWHVLDAMQRTWLPLKHHWRLNERHYGGLQGLNKDDMARRYGAQQVLLWRRSYDVPPPPLHGAAAQAERADRRYASVPADQFPAGECLKDTVARVLPLWQERIAPAIRSGQRVLIAAHGNSLRALVKHLDGMTDEAIVGLNIPNAAPLIYELDASLAPVRRFYLHNGQAAAGLPCPA